ncbi:hypothetical protein [Microcystis phage Mwe-JY05]
MVPRPLVTAFAVVCVIVIALNGVFGSPTVGLIVAGLLGMVMALTRPERPAPALQPAGHRRAATPTFTEHELAAFAALTDDDRDEMAALGFDLTGLPTPDATPAAPMTHGKYLRTAESVQISDDGWVRITASDGSRIEYPLVGSEQPPPVGDPITPDTGVLPDAAAAWHREAGARPARRSRDRYAEAMAEQEQRRGPDGFRRPPPTRSGE